MESMTGHVAGVYMTKLKWQILKFLAKHDSCPLREITSEMTDWEYMTVRKALQDLTDHGVIAKLEKKRYKLRPFAHRLLDEAGS